MNQRHARFVTAYIVIALATTAALVYAADKAEAATSSCRIFVHRANAPGLDEEQPGGIKRAGKWGGAEIDVRLSADGTPWSIHDAGVGRITGGEDKRKVLNMTDAELRAVVLKHGAHPRTFGALVKAAAKHKVRLVVELKAVPASSATRWVTAPSGQPTGLDQLAAAATANGWANKIIWNTGRPNVYANVKADSRFNTRLMVRPNVYGPDPSELDDALFGSFGNTPDRKTVDLITGHGATPFYSRAVKVANVRAARRLGVRVFQAHYPATARKGCV